MVQWLVQNPRTGDTSILPVNPGSSYAGVSFGPQDRGRYGHYGHHHGRTNSFGPSSTSFGPSTTGQFDGQQSFGPTLLSSNRLNAFQKDYILGQSSSDEDKTVFELHITSTVLNDSATYACKISNEFGDDVHNIELTILGKCQPFIVVSRFMIFFEVYCLVTSRK